MASHSRHVLSTPGEVRVQIKFRREDLLHVHDGPLRDPHAAERRCRAAAEGWHPDLLVHEVPGLPLRTEDGNFIGPTILDMLVRGVWRVEDLPLPAQKTVRAAARAAGKARPPREVIAWSVRDLDTLWPKPGEESRRAPRDPDEEGEGCEAEHPFVPGLVSGGTPHGTAAGGWARVRKYSTCQIGEYIYRVASGMHGGLGGAYGRVAEAAAEAWRADQARALELWDLVRAAPGGVLLEDEVVRRLRPICSVSQEVERAVMREVCRWLGVDPDLALRRERGRPKGAGRTADQGEIIRLALQPDGTVRGAFIADYEGVREGTELHGVELHVLVAALGALRLAGLETDHALLEAWLDAALPDWRDRVAEGGNDGASGGAAPDPYDVLGVTPHDDMAAVTAAYRRAMKAVHPDTSGASAWLSRAVADAYKQIRAARAVQEEKAA